MAGEGELEAMQRRLEELGGEYKRVVEVMGRKEHEQKMAVLTGRQLEALPAETVVYRAVGKAFMQSHLGQIKESLASVGKGSAADIERLAGQRARLEASLREAEGKAKALYDELQQ